MCRGLTKGAEDFIDDTKLHSLISDSKEDIYHIRDIFDKSRAKEPLSIEETAALLSIRSPEALEELFETAKELKRSVYGKRIVLFAPLYIGNNCINDCTYCGFRKELRTTVRKTLSKEELILEVEQLEREGHKRLILVYGEHPKYTPEFIADTVRTCYGVKVGNGEIRRININAAPLTKEGFSIVKEAGIGTFQVFQESYHKETYSKYHLSGTKSDYMWRLNSMDRAYEGGIDDVGIGALFGLYDWRFEVLGLVSHSLYLQKKYGVGPHTISFPRIQKAHGMDFDLPWRVGDEQFKQLVATLRIAVPYTGLIMTARESPAVRDAVMEYGVSQIDAGTRLEIGAYQKERKEVQELDKEQFEIGDQRGLDSVIHWLLSRDFIPSFCTSCYRLGRTGEHFMEYAMPGFIGRFCTPNALLTLAEYLEDYSTDTTKEEGYRLIAQEIAHMEVHKQIDVEEKINEIKRGKRDLLY